MVGSRVTARSYPSPFSTDPVPLSRVVMTHPIPLGGGGEEGMGIHS
jgi:hypothetical protein